MGAAEPIFASAPTMAPSHAALDGLSDVSRSGGPGLEAFVRAHAPTLVRGMRRSADRQGVGAARWLDRRLRALDPTLDLAGNLDRARRAAIAGLALSLPARGPCRPLPACVEALYPPAFDILAASLAADAPDDAVYDPDNYAKDARFVAGMTAPAGAQVVDIAFPQGLGAGSRRLAHMAAMIGRLALAGAGPDAGLLLRDRGLGHWLEIHTDSRNLGDFNPAGWDDCYRRVADILLLNPDLAGLWGASWFYDPQLAAISPRLAYLQEAPLARGAVTIRLGEGAIHTQRAGQTSSTRAALIASGRYRPVCYALFWPRKALLAWAAQG